MVILKATSFLRGTQDGHLELLGQFPNLIFEQIFETIR